MKKVRYPNLDDYDLSCYEELKGDILYKINGGTTMSPADQQRMAEAGKCGDKKTQERIISTYETKDNTSTPSGDGGIGPAASAPPSICTTPVQTESPASPTASTSAETNGASTPGSAVASASPEQTASQVSPSSVTPTGPKGVSMTTSTPYSTAPMQTKPPSQTSALDHGQQAEMARMDAESRIGGAGSSASSYSGGGCSGQGGSSSSLDSNSKRSDGSQRYASALTDREQYEMALKDMEEKKSTDNASGSPCGTKIGGSGRIEYDTHNPNRILANLDDRKSLQAAAELLSDVNLGYTVTAYGEKSGGVRNFKNYAEINEYLVRISDEDSLLAKETDVKKFLISMAQNPDRYYINAYQRRALAPGEKTEMKTHSLYAITDKVTKETKTLSFYGTKLLPFSEGAWGIDTETDVDSYESYKNGGNIYDMSLLFSSDRIDVQKTAGNIVNSINSSTSYFFIDHKVNLSNMDNCNTALYNTIDFKTQRDFLGN